TPFLVSTIPRQPLLLPLSLTRRSSDLTDRIARDVAYQTIIIGELIKHGKQIIIKGKDYIHNPESKFTLTDDDLLAVLDQLADYRSEEHTSELQSLTNIVCRLLI